ncbi:MAG: type II toxin-antitoxin system RelE/ParE family toxin [Hyphomicrobiales bacterium]|nr:type II toxin-antitoxin system RelE/ParE family toxin [Hyphomicrobiales bacterium]
MIKTYKLSPAAIGSIAEIVAYNDEAFGVNQTAAYIAGLESSFELIVKFPGTGVAAFEVKAGLRRYRYQSHYILYTEQRAHIRIEDIFHVRRKIRSDLFDT